MKKVLVRLYQLLSPGMRRSLGNSTLLKPLRSIMLRNNGEFRETDVIITRTYQKYHVNFRFFSSIQIAAKAKKRGIENTLIKNSLILLKKYKGDSNKHTVLDVGSNFGYLSLIWAQTIAANGKVVAFEPNIRVVKSLKKSVVINGLEERIVIENVALGNNNKEIDLYNFNTTSNTLKTFDSSLVETEGYKVQMKRLDDYVEQKKITHVELLKIDVDGIELEILRGAKNMIHKLRPLIIVEVNEEPEIFNFLKENRYIILNLNLEQHNLQVITSNLFCIPCEDFVSQSN